MAFLLRTLKTSAWVFLGLLVLYAVGRPIQIWLDGFYSGVREPYLQMASANEMTLRWQSEQAFVGVVRYGVNESNLNLISHESNKDEEHEVRLANLKPNTKYFYSVGSKDKADFKGSEFWFKTSPKVAASSSKTTRFWVTGDQGFPGIVQNDVRDGMLKWLKENPRSSKEQAKLDLWVTTGDNAYRSGSNEQFQVGFFEPYKNILRNTPVWPAYGNHDARRWAFFDIFTLPTKAESGGVASGTEHYYSFDFANIHFVMLDTQDSKLTVDSEMLSWLKEDLEKTKQQWLIAIFHHPPYTKGSHDSDDRRDSRGRLISVRENILPMLERYGADVVLSGHSHVYERSELISCHYGSSKSFDKNMIRQKAKYTKKDKNISAYSGTIYTVIGSSSALDKGSLDHPALPYSLHEAGSMFFDVNKNNLKAYFVNDNGVVKDQFEIIKGVSTGVLTQNCP